MFTLPSMWNLIISTVMFSIAAWYFHRILDDQGIPKGMTRGILVFTLASLVSWGVGDTVNWVHEKIEGPQPVVHASSNMSQLLKAIVQTHK
ncbi:MAG TPA: hypothetical protein VND43_02320 [Burkholderiales bacterium]|nr:hypothetical protein [Burkholderiales bacterium]